LKYKQYNINDKTLYLVILLNCKRSVQEGFKVKGNTIDHNKKESTPFIPILQPMPFQLPGDRGLVDAEGGGGAGLGAVILHGVAKNFLFYGTQAVFEGEFAGGERV